MDIKLGLMMTAAALFQEVESPVGTVASMFPPGTDMSQGIGALPHDPERDQVIAHMRATWAIFQREVVQHPLNQPQLYSELNRSATGQGAK